MIKSTDKYMYFKVKDLPMCISFYSAWASKWLFGYKPEIWYALIIILFIRAHDVSWHKTNTMHEVIEAVWGGKGKLGMLSGSHPIGRDETRHMTLLNKNKMAPVVKGFMTIRI